MKLVGRISTLKKPTMFWAVIYPKGDRSRLSCAQVVDYERDEWALASREEFPDTDEGKRACHLYMLELAKKHGLRTERVPGEHDFLD